jgi:hypothetical protein
MDLKTIGSVVIGVILGLALHWAAKKMGVSG